MTIYKSSFSNVQSFTSDGVFDFLFTNNPTLQPDKPALIDGLTGETVRSESGFQINASRADQLRL